MKRTEQPGRTDPVESLDVEAHGWTNVNETVVRDEEEAPRSDVEGHSLISNVNETVVRDEDEAGNDSQIAES